MFTKKPEKDGPVIDAGKPGLNPLRPGGPPQMSNARPSARGGSGTPSVIGPDLSITGNLESKGEIQIEGEVQGDIHAARIIVGAPVIAGSTYDRIRQAADDVAAIIVPDDFHGIGQWYEDFSLITDDEVRHLFAEAAQRQLVRSPHESQTT